MARVQMLPPRLKAAPTRANTVEKPAVYGQGRGGRPWRRKVEAVKLRDKYTCQKCGCIAIDGECDHRIPEFEGGTDDIENLQWMCRVPCHKEKTQAEAARARRGRPGG